jgi:Mg2+ and Co2+ transporter CorA
MLLEASRQSVVQRKFAAWAAILAFPTAVAGIYGMNFQNMPELSWHYGYFAVLGFISVGCVVCGRVSRGRAGCEQSSGSLRRSHLGCVCCRRL